MRSAEAAVDREIARLADAQRGIVTHAQLLDAGLDAHAIKRRRERNLLRIVHRGVYVVGHTALAPLALETAAVLACRARALLSGLSSLSVCEVRKTQDGRSVELTVVGRNPPFRTQVWIGQYRVDRLWAEQRVVVEIDGWIFHRDRKRFESDQRRDGDLRAAGCVVLRFTRRQVMFEPEYVLFRLGQALSSVGLPARA